MLAGKGLRELVSAVKIINKDKIVCKLLLYGPFDTDNISSIAIEEIKDWDNIPGVKYKGITDKPELEMQKGDCVVLPSYREGLPKALCEASACGKPIVTTDVPGCRDAIIKNQTGILVPPRDFLSLAMAIKKLLNDKKLSRSMGIKGRINAEENFNIHKVVESHINIYKRI